MKPIKDSIIIWTDGTRWKIREAVSMKEAENAIVNAKVSGSVGSSSIHDQRLAGGVRIVLADVVQINSDGSERKPYAKVF